MKKKLKKLSKQIFILSRTQIITPKLINKIGTLSTHVGKNLSFLEINSQYMLGHKVGEYAPTKKLGRIIHFKQKEKKQKKR